MPWAAVEVLRAVRSVADLGLRSAPTTILRTPTATRRVTNGVSGYLRGLLYTSSLLVLRFSI